MPAPASISDAQSLLNARLDHVDSVITSANAVDVIEMLCPDLANLCDHAIENDWLAGFKSNCQQHALFSKLLQDPYTCRAFQKPRGFAGDAVMLDYVYFGACPPETSGLGKAIFKATTRLSNGLSVIYRRDFVANYLDRVAGDHDGASVLSVACGHLREANDSVGVRQAKFASLSFRPRSRKSRRCGERVRRNASQGRA